jgi:Ca2+-binding RTX toxin-like protein
MYMLNEWPAGAGGGTASGFSFAAAGDGTLWVLGDAAALALLRGSGPFDPDADQYRTFLAAVSGTPAPDPFPEAPFDPDPATYRAILTAVSVGGLARPFLAARVRIGSERDDETRGGEGADLILGRGGDDTLRGGGGDDAIWGGSGDDRLLGQRGDDLLDGDGGRDEIHGGSGDDVLVGGGGQDALRGGNGSDAFVFLSAAAAGTAARRADRIGDFDRGEDDVIDLSGIDARAASARDDSFDFVGEDGFRGSAGELRWNAQRGRLEGDVDGDARADFYIRVATEDLPVAADLIL